MANKPLTSEEFKTIYSKVPRFCLELIVRTSEGIVLTLRRLPTWNNQWHIPGATLFYGERVDDAVQRIAHDELGISVIVDELLGYNEYPSEQKERGFGWSVGLIFLCHPADQDQQMRPNDEASMIRAFREIPENIIKEHAIFLRSKGLLNDNLTK